MKKFIEKGYNVTGLKEKIDKANIFDREDLLQHLKISKNGNRIPLVLPYNQKAPNVSKILEKHWSTFQVNETMQKSFTNTHIINFKRSKNLRDITGRNIIVNGKVKKQQNIRRTGTWSPCFSSKNTMCCTQVTNNTLLPSCKIRNYFTIYHSLNCKSKYLIYPIECTLCKLKYVGKAETPSNIRINNQISDVFDPNETPTCRHVHQ